MDAKKPYVWMNDHGTHKVGQSDVSLDSVVVAFWEGLSPECIQQQYPTLSLEEVYGAIAYYLGHRDEVDAYLREREELWQRMRQEAEKYPSPTRERLRALKASLNDAPNLSEGRNSQSRMRRLYFA